MLLFQILSRKSWMGQESKIRANLIYLNNSIFSRATSDWNGQDQAQRQAVAGLRPWPPLEEWLRTFKLV